MPTLTDATMIISNTLNCENVMIAANSVEHVFRGYSVSQASGDPHAYVLTGVVPTGDDLEPLIPERLVLHQNVPNPFNPWTRISFSLPKRAKTRLVIYDVSGRLVTTLLDNVIAEGYKEVIWDGKNSRGVTVSSGLYFYHLTTTDRTITKKMVLLK